MKISLNWLKDYIDLSSNTITDITTALTSIGLEVESVEELKPVSELVVVGKIVDCKPHPNADGLRMTSVSIGESDLLQIVCGAPNARIGITVAVAKIGAILPGNFIIKKSKIRGEDSYGMLCSESELKIGDHNDGILELETAAPLGTSISKIFDLDDTVITLGLTPNRADCNGYIGIARDLAARLERPLKLANVNNSEETNSFSTADVVRLDVENADDCDHFVLLAMKGVKPISSPIWMRNRLIASGMRPINLLVDATNYAMLENSQPIHAYDIRALKGGHIKVRRAKLGESIETLDGKTLELSSENLVIADASSPIGIAGIMGGSNSEVREDTSEIVIEVARFNERLIRKSSKMFGLHTEASHRFERGVDSTNLQYVAMRVAGLIRLGMTQARLNPPVIASSNLEYYPNLVQPLRIALRLERLKQLTGFALITSTICRNILERLGFHFLDQKENRMVFEVPAWRVDIMREADLIEEVARIYGYEKLTYSFPLMEIKPLPEDPLIEFCENLKTAVAQTGFHEIISFPFVSSVDLKNLSLQKDHPMLASVKLKNPLNADQELLSTTTIINLLKASQNNRRLGITSNTLFELARCFYHNPKPQTGYLESTTRQGRHISGRGLSDRRPIERTAIGLLMDQPKFQSTWDQKERAVDFFDLKGACEDIAAHLGLKRIMVHREGISQLPWLNPNKSAWIRVGNRDIGYLGEVHPRTANGFGFDLYQLPIVAELDVEELFLASIASTIAATPSGQFPSIKRDLAFIIDQNVDHSDFCKTLETFKAINLRKFELFDVYKGENIPQNKKSMAYSFIFQSNERTLTDKEVEREIEAIKGLLKDSLAAVLR